MKATVLRDQLKEGLVTVERAISKSLTLPILQNILCSSEKNFLELAATDLEIGVRFRMLSKNAKTGQVVVPSRVLSQLAGFLPEASVVLGEVGGQFMVVSGDYSTNVKVVGPEEFPVIPSIGDGDYMEVNPKIFCAGVGQVVSMVGQSQARPEITGVFVSFEKGVARVVATDSFRLGEKTILLDNNSSKDTSFILPAKAAREIVSIFGEKEGALKLYLSSAQAIFDYTPQDLSQPQIQVVSRLIDGEYPRYQDVIPQKYKIRAEIGRLEFVNHIRAASIFAGKTNEVCLIFRPEEKGIEISSRSSDVGEHTSLIPATIEGEQGEVSFNWRFLLDGVLALKSASIEFKISSEDGPAAILPQEQEGFLYIIMPIKV